MLRHPALSKVDHRPWPLPRGPWIMAQSWRDLLFAHWPVEPEVLRALVPAELELDLFDGRGWVGVVPFRMQGVRLRGLPALPGVGAFPELNVRTYVRGLRGSGPGGGLGGGPRGGNGGDAARPGVWFFSLDAARRLAVQTARAWFHLPYYFAHMRSVNRGEAVEYASERRERGASPARCRAHYEPIGAVELSAPGSLAHWLTERYRLYARRADGALFAGEIHHEPWPLQPARAAFELEEVSRAAGLELRGDPLLHFARRLDVVVWTPQRLGPEAALERP